MAATFDDAKAGWEILRASGFSLSREELNARLKSRGLAPISPRTFAHYSKLRRYGYESYIPINQLDVKTLQDPLWDKAVRGRYPVYHDPVEVYILGSYAGKDFEIRGRTVEFSSSYVRLRVDNPKTLELLSKDKFRRHLRANRVITKFPGTGDSYPTRLEEITLHVQESSASLVVGFVSLASVEHISGRTLLPTGELHVRILPSRNDPLLSEVVRKLYWLFHALDTSKVIAEEYLTDLGLGKKYAVPSVRVKELSMRSPLEATIVAGVPALMLITFLAKRLLKVRTEYHEGSRRREAARNLKLRNEILAETSDLIKRRLLRSIEKAEEQGQLPLDGSSGRANELAESQLLPSLDELLDQASGKVELEADTDDEDLEAG